MMSSFLRLRILWADDFCHSAIKASLDRRGAARRRCTTLGRSGPSLEESPSMVQNWIVANITIDHFWPASSRSYFRLLGAIRFWRNSCRTHYIHIDYMVIILHIIVDTMLPFTLADNLAKAVKKPEVGHLGRSTSPWRGWLFYTLGEFLRVINVSKALRSEVQKNPWLEKPIKTNKFHTGSSTTSLASACTRPGPHCPPCDWKWMERTWSCSWSWPLRTFRWIVHQWTIYTILFLQWYTAN